MRDGQLLGALAFVGSILGALTFYLATWWFPFLLSLSGVGVGLFAYLRRGKDRRAGAAIVVGIIGFLLALVSLLLD